MTDLVPAGEVRQLVAEVLDLLSRLSAMVRPTPTAGLVDSLSLQAGDVVRLDWPDSPGGWVEVTDLYRDALTVTVGWRATDGTCGSVSGIPHGLDVWCQRRLCDDCGQIIDGTPNTHWPHALCDDCDGPF